MTEPRPVTIERDYCGRCRRTTDRTLLGECLACRPTVTAPGDATARAPSDSEIRAYGACTPVDEVVDWALTECWRAGVVREAVVSPSGLNRLAKRTGGRLEGTPEQPFVRMHSAIGWVNVYEDKALVGEPDEVVRLRVPPVDDSITFGTAWSSADREERERRFAQAEADAREPPQPWSSTDPAQRTLAEFARPPVEDYVRVTIEFGSYTYEPAVEWRDGDGFYEMTQALEECALAASLEAVPHVKPPSDPMKQARLVGDSIRARWPDRAYFVEVWQEGQRGFGQTFQPWGLPRNR